MADNKEITGKPDRDRISLSEEYEIRDWSEKYGVTKEELREAVRKVGNRAEDVEAYLKKGK